MQVVAPPFGKLMSTEQQLEGEYRQLHSRLRTHSESIAFYGGQDREASIITQRFRSIIGSAYSILANVIVKIVLRVLQEQPYECNVVIFPWCKLWFLRNLDSFVVDNSGEWEKHENALGRTSGAFQLIDYVFTELQGISEAFGQSVAHTMVVWDDPGLCAEVLGVYLWPCSDYRTFFRWIFKT
jgi:ABC-type uncharacterized transport system fused permease/ATPase subunit